MRRITSLLTATAVTMGLAVAPAANAQALTLAQLYNPSGIPNYYLYDVPPGTKTVGPIQGLPDLKYIQDVQFQYTNPENVTITEGWYESHLDFTLQNAQIYPQTINVPFSAVIIYTDGTMDTVSGSFGIKPLPAMVSGTPISSTALATPLPTLTVTSTMEVPGPVEYITETVTAEPTTVTTTVTEPVVETVTETSVVTTTAAPVTKTAAPVTTTKTAAPITVTAPPVTVTETTTKEAPAPGAGDSGSSVGGIFALIAAVLAMLGGGAYYWFNFMK